MSLRPTRSTSGQLPKRFQGEEVNIPVVKQRTASGNGLPQSRSNSSTSKARETLLSSPQSTSTKMPKASPNKTVDRGPGRPPKIPVLPQPPTTPPSSQATPKRPTSTSRAQTLRSAPSTPQSKVKRSSAQSPKNTPKTKNQSTPCKNVPATPAKISPVPSPTPSPPPRRALFVDELDDMALVTDGCKFTMDDKLTDFVPTQDNAWDEMSDGIKIILITQFEEILGSLRDAANFLSLSSEERIDYQKIWEREIQRDKDEGRLIRAANRQSSNIFMNGFVHGTPEYNGVQEDLYKKAKVVREPAAYFVTKEEVAEGVRFLEERTRKGVKQIWMRRRLGEFVGMQTGPVVERDWGVDSEDEEERK